MQRKAIAALALAAVSCGKDGDSSVRLSREGDAPAVAYVEGSAQLDLGSAKEQEPNNDKATANPLTLPVAVTGVLASSSDVDVYKFVAATSGHVRIRLSAVEGADLMIEAASAAGSDVRVADRGPNTIEGIPNLPVKKGETYYVSVLEYVKPPSKPKRGAKKKGKGAEPAAAGVREGDSPPYSLEVSIEAERKPSEIADWELEPNEDPSDAKLIRSGDRPAGYIGWTDDLDVYKLSLEGFSDEDLIEISVDGIEGVSLNLEIVDPAGKKVFAREGGKGSPLYVRGLQAGGAAFFTAKLSAKRSHESQTYRFHFATRRLQPGDEVEPNDEAKLATPLGDDAANEGEARGEIYGGDVDWFVLPAREVPREVSLSVTNDGGVQVEIDAVIAGDSQGTLRGDVRKMNIVVAKGARLRLKVTGKGGGEPTGYAITWSAKEIEPPPSFDPGFDLE